MPKVFFLRSGQPNKGTQSFIGSSMATNSVLKKPLETPCLGRKRQMGLFSVNMEDKSQSFSSCNITEKNERFLPRLRGLKIVSIEIKGVTKPQQIL